MKNILQSKTIITNFLIVVLSVLVPDAKEVVAENPELSVIIVSAVNIVLRFLTNKKVVLL